MYLFVSIPTSELKKSNNEQSYFHTKPCKITLHKNQVILNLYPKLTSLMCECGTAFEIRVKIFLWCYGSHIIHIKNTNKIILIIYKMSRTPYYDHHILIFNSEGALKAYGKYRIILQEQKYCDTNQCAFKNSYSLSGLKIASS